MKLNNNRIKNRRDIDEEMPALLMPFLVRYHLFNGDYYIDNGVYYIDNGVYYIDNGVYYIDNGVYYIDNGVYYIDNGVYYIDNGVYYKLESDSDGNKYYKVVFTDYTKKKPDESLCEVVIPGYIDGIPVKKIDPFSFYETYVDKIEILEGVVEIAHNAFDKCEYLEELKLPSSIKKFEPSSTFTAKINISNDCQFIPDSLVEHPKVNFLQKDKLLKTLSSSGNVNGVVWYNKYNDDFGCEHVRWAKLIGDEFDKTKEYTISLDEEQKYFDDNKIDFEVDDLDRFNRLIYLLYPTLNDIPNPVPDFKSLFVNFKEWTNLGLDIQIIYDNPDMVFKSFSETLDNIYNNYSLLSSQNNITSTTMLQKIYFGFYFDSKEDLFRKLQQSIKENYKIEPTTVIKLMDDSEDDLVKQKLKDSLIYASHIIPLNVDNIDNKNMVELREIIAHDVFENISKSNNDVYKDLYGIYPDQYSLLGLDSDIFDGAHYHIRKDLERINSNFYNINSKINLSPTEISGFLETLSTIKKWDKLSIDKKRRAILLKNEVIGRVLYATMRTALESDESFIQVINEYESEKLTIENNSELSKKGKNKQTNKLNKNLGKKISSIVSQMDFYNLDLNECKNLFMKYLFYTDFNNEIRDVLDKLIDAKVIKKMIQLNPYTFDMLRNGEQIKDVFYTEAFDNDYFFREQEDLNVLKRIIESQLKSKQEKKEKLEKPMEQTPFSVVAQYMLNDIENNPKSEKFDKIFEVNIRRMLDEFFYGSDKNEMVLFNIFRGIDAFLGKKLSIEAQGIGNRNVKMLSNEIFDENVRKLSNEIFDLTCRDKYNNYDRLCYSLFNLNRLAHGISDISMKKIELDFNRYKSNSSDSGRLRKILESYERLSRFGFMPKDVNSLLEKNSRGELRNNIKKILDDNYPKAQKALELNNLLYESDKKIEDKDVDDIVKDFKKIIDVDDSIRNQIESDAEEQRMYYDAKKVVGENFVRMLSEFASKSLGNQREFFKRYGFVVECQYDESDKGDDLLVVYNPKFGNTFSVHMKDMDDETRNIFDLYKKVDQTRTLCCTKVKGGLVEFEQVLIKDGDELIELCPSKFVDSEDYSNNEIDENLLNASVQFHNFLEYDCEVYKERIDNANGNQEELKRIISEIFDRVPIKNFDEVNIKKENGDGTYSSTNILSLISDKIGIRLDTAINTVNDIMSREENEEIVKFDDKYTGLVVHCLEQSNYQKNELGDMMSEYVTPDTDDVSQNKHI